MKIFIFNSLCVFSMTANKITRTKLSGKGESDQLTSKFLLHLKTLKELSLFYRIIFNL